MALAQSIPPGITARYTRRTAEVLNRPRRLLGWNTTVRRAIGWLGLTWLTAVWLQGLAVSLRIHRLVSDYEHTYGPALDQYRGLAPRAPELSQFTTTLAGVRTGTGTLLFLVFFPISLLVLFGLWVGCSRWALAHRPVAWRRTFLAAALVVLAQTVLLYPAIETFTWITD